LAYKSRYCGVNAWHYSSCVWKEGREEGERATEEDRRVDGAFEGKLLIIAALSGDTNMRNRLLANCL